MRRNLVLYDFVYKKHHHVTLKHKVQLGNCWSFIGGNIFHLVVGMRTTQ